MSLIEEIKEIRKVFLLIFTLLFIFTLFFFCFGLKKIKILKWSFYFPFPTLNSFSTSLFKKIKADLLPKEVKIIVTNPLSAFLAQIWISLFLAFLVIFPFLLWQIIKYLWPALYEREKKIALLFIFSSSILFVFGSLFAYFFVIPLSFKILYKFSWILGVHSFFSLNEFLIWNFSLMLLVGTMFLLPIFMICLSYMGIIKKNTWRKNWPNFLLICLIFNAIITPDGTGITQIILTLPLILLYFLGYIFSKG